MTSETKRGKEERPFERIAAGLLPDPEVSQGTGFRSTPGLRVETKIFAMLSRDGELVVKLPEERVDQLVASGNCVRFDPRHEGRLMKEWVVIPARRSGGWRALVAEALRFVRPTPRGTARARRSSEAPSWG